MRTLIFTQKREELARFTTASSTDALSTPTTARVTQGMTVAVTQDIAVTQGIALPQGMARDSASSSDSSDEHD